MNALLLAWSVVAATFTVVALAGRNRRPLPVTAPPRDAIVLLRPLDAPTAAERANLESVPADVEQWVLCPFSLGLAGPSHWLPSDPLLHNRKLGHLKYAIDVLELSGREVLVVDADVRVDDALVRALRAGLASGAALSWAAPRPSRPGLEKGLLVESIHSFEVLDGLTSGAKPLCGKALGLGPRAVEALRALPDCVGEDLELSSALHARALQVVLAGQADMPGPTSLASSVARFTRWMQVLRAHRPLLFPTVPLLFACTPLLILAGAFLGFAPLRLMVVGVVVLRSVLAAQLERRPGLFLWWLGAELLLLVCWTRAWAMGPRVTWRGRAFELGKGGKLGWTAGDAR